MADIMVVRMPCPDHPENLIGTQTERDENGTTKTTVIEPCPEHRGEAKQTAKSK